MSNLTLRQEEIIDVELIDTFTPGLSNSYPNQPDINNFVETLSESISDRINQKLTTANNDSEIIQEWLMRYQNDKTRKLYGEKVKRVMAWLGSDSLVTVTPVKLNTFKALLGSFYQLSKNTIGNYVSILKSLFSYCHKVGYRSTNPMVLVDSIKPQKALRQRILSKGDVKSLINNAPNKRLATSISFMAFCGLRVSELLSLKFSDLKARDDKPGYYVAGILGKGDKYREVEITPGFYEKFVELKLTDSEYIFSENGCNVYSYQNFLDSFKAVAKKSRLTATPHYLRHFCATYLVSKGVPVKEIQKLLGHSSINTTNDYVELVSGKFATQSVENDELFS
jgi:integrase/recombinase XerD